jgi:2-polyprenyl-6-methoxyphenol hydroxylase-like FAD-dependent oxidoreductase
MSSLPPNTDVVDVLIIGAGPAGLSTALSIFHHTYLSPLSTPGHSTKPKIFLVDSLLQGQNKSRALGFHSRTLEVSYFSLADTNYPH